MKLKYKKIIVSITMGTMCIGLIALSVGNSNKSKETLVRDVSKVEATKDTELEETKEEKEGENETNTVKVVIEDDGSLKKDAYPVINQLFQKYYASRAACNIEVIQTLVSNPEMITLEKLQSEAEYIEDYKNIECYTIKGPEENSFVTYVYQEYKISGIDTLAPGMKRFYVKLDDSGNAMIYMGEIKDEMKKEIDETAEKEEVKQLIQSVENKLAEAMAKDEKLYTFQKNLEEEAEKARKEQSE